MLYSYFLVFTLYYLTHTPQSIQYIYNNVAEPDPSDPYVFGPPGSGPDPSIIMQK